MSCDITFRNHRLPCAWHYAECFGVIAFFLCSFFLMSPSSGVFTCAHLAGSGVTLGLQGLKSLEEFVCKIATAMDQSNILEALATKTGHSRPVAERFTRNGLLATGFK